MPHYLSLIVYKSVLQSLTANEADWLFHHFRVTIPPVLFSEMIADLHGKKGIEGRSEEQYVSAIFKKLEPNSVAETTEYTLLIKQEFRGYRFPMDGRPVVPHGERVRMPDGSFGAYIDQTPLQRVIDRWKGGDFSEMEREFARVWRQGVSEINLEDLFRKAKHRRIRSVSTLEDALRIARSILASDGRDFQNLARWLDLLNFERSFKDEITARWKLSGRPDPRLLFPYTLYVLTADVFFHIAVAHGLLSTRQSNLIDLEYIKYLPFATAFSSSDRLHKTLFPFFSRADQTFIWGPKLKQCLRDMVDFYDNLPDETKKHGTYTYADLPPVHMDNALTRAFDKRSPDWRDRANRPRPPRTPEEDAEILKRLKPMMDAIKAHKARSGRY